MTLEAPGYVVDELIGFGGSGEVWRARDETTGEVVALKRLRGSDDPAARDRLRREAALLAQLAGPHVVPLRGVLSTPSGPVLVLEYAAGGSLAGLRAVRPRLDTGEVVTLGLPLALTLAEAHRRGVVHGDLSPSNVLFTADGRPMLADLGVARLVGEMAIAPEVTDGYADPAVLAGGAVTTASDSYALGVLLTECLTGAAFSRASRDALLEVAPTSLAAALSAAVSPDPAARPTPDEIALALRELGAPAPLRLDLAHRPTGAPSSPVTAAVTPAPAPPVAAVRRTARERLGSAGLWRPALGLVGVVALVAVAVLVGLLLSRGAASEAATATPLTETPATNWTTVLTELDAVRDDAFAAGDPDALAAAYVAGSAALRTETERLRALLDQRLVVRGLELQLVKVAVVRADRTRALLQVTDRLPSYELVDATGRLVARRPARPAHTWEVELAKVGTGWRIASVRSGG